MLDSWAEPAAAAGVDDKRTYQSVWQARSGRSARGTTPTTDNQVIRKRNMAVFLVGNTVSLQRLRGCAAIEIHM